MRQGGNVMMLRLADVLVTTAFTPYMAYRLLFSFFNFHLNTKL